MEKSGKIIVLFGPSGSGKSYVADKLCEDPRFYHVKKASDRPKRANDVSVRHIGGKLYSFNYVSEDAVQQSEIRFENFGHSYSLNIGDVDRCIISGQTPVIILRTREHFETLRNLYPNFEIEKFYIRPDKDLLVQQLSMDTTRSSEQIQGRISKINQEYSYHDETLALDPSITVVENDYQSDDFLDVIKDKVNLDEAQALSTSQLAEIDRTICFGDKIRISCEPDPGAPDSYLWYAKVIAGEKLKMDLPSSKTFNELLSHIISKMNPNMPLDFEKTFTPKSTKNISQILEFLSKSLGQYETSFLGLPHEDLKYVREEVTNQKNLYYAYRVFSIPSVVLDIDIDHLGFKFDLSTPAVAPVLQDENFKRDLNKRRFDLIGFMAQSQSVRKSSFTAQSMQEAIEELVLAISQKQTDPDAILFPSDYIEDRLVGLCLDLPDGLVKGIKKLS